MIEDFKQLSALAEKPFDLITREDAEELQIALSRI